MNLTFLPGTEIAIIDDLCPQEVVDDIYELLSWAEANKFQLNYVEHDDLSMMPSDGMEPEEIEGDTKKHYNVWGQRNFNIGLYPSRYKKLTEEVMSKAANKAFNAYGEALGLDFSDHRPISLDAYHVLKDGDAISRHVDCFDYGIVYYVGQTADTEGGDLWFIESDIKLPFKANRMLIIPADLEHEVLPVTAGKRFSSTDFVPVGLDWQKRDT